MSNEKEYIINGRRWFFVKQLPTYQLWYSNYFCSDGDGVGLYIENENGGFTLKCFSGIPASEIYIDKVDFGIFQYAPNIVEDLDFSESFEQQCCRIADLLCGRFCNLIK